jgi:POT family proton-dependent oligopeptide transporter
MFWSGFEQAGSSLNLFADRHTFRTLPLEIAPQTEPPTTPRLPVESNAPPGSVTVQAFEVPAGWFQSLNSVFVIGLAPLAAMLWVTLARRQLSPSLTAKMAWGLLLLAAGFAIVGLGARQALASGRVWPTWLIATYFVHTLGELCLSPVGLSAVTKLAPQRLVGQMMGVWFLGTSLGNLMAGLLAGNVSGENLAAMPVRFFQIVVTAGVTGLALLLLAEPIQRLAGGVQ